MHSTVFVLTLLPVEVWNSMESAEQQWLLQTMCISSGWPCSVTKWSSRLSCRGHPISTMLEVTELLINPSCFTNVCKWLGARLYTPVAMDIIRTSEFNNYVASPNTFVHKPRLRQCSLGSLNKKLITSGAISRTTAYVMLHIWGNPYQRVLGRLH